MDLDRCYEGKTDPPYFCGVRYCAYSNTVHRNTVHDFQRHWSPVHVPNEKMQAFDHKNDSAVGHLVLIPAQKYKAYVEHDPLNRPFLGWVGKIMSYEDRRKKAKVKIFGDTGYEHLMVKGSSKYAIDSLVRLM